METRTMNLNGRCMRASGTAANGVVGAGTVLRFFQVGAKVIGRYSGGRIRRGCLIGQIADARLSFRYLQREETGELHCGRSECDVRELPDGRVRIIEHFRWSTRAGSGVNVFEEV